MLEIGYILKDINDIDDIPHYILLLICLPGP